MAHQTPLQSGHTGSPAPPSDSLQEAIDRLGPWFQNLHLPGGLQTAPNHPLGDFPLFKWKAIQPHLPASLAGWRVLDIGCNAGFYCFELVARGAAVLGIDREPFYLAQANWAREQLGFGDRVQFKGMQIYDLVRQNETFDLVVFMGVFYHLRYPLLGLDIAAQKVGKLMLFQTLTMPGNEVYPNTSGLKIDQREALLEPGWPRMAFFEHEFADDRTNWWAPNHACVEAMLRTSGLRVIARPADEIYLCERDEQHPACASTWNAEEFLSATGRL
jgi:tRNA (mo5U34)-methyltransferase